MENFYDFIEIGTSDFDTVIQTCKEDSKGLTIEPLKFYLDKLPNKKNVQKINCAISNEEGECFIYHISEENILKYNMPWWVKGCNSMEKEHSLVVSYLKDNQINCTFDRYLIKKCKLKTLIDQNKIFGVYFLKIDTEGHDCKILNNFLDDINENIYLPHVIKFETNKHTDKYTVINTINKLKQIGYDLISYDRKSDTIVKLNLNKIKNKTKFTNEIKNYKINDEKRIKFNSFEEAKLQCINLNGTGIVKENSNYFICFSDYLEESDLDVSVWIYI